MSEGSSDLLVLAESVVRKAKARGVDETAVTVSQGTHTSLQRRAGKVEQATQSTTRGLVLSLLQGDRWSSHSTSDLREGALDAFLDRAVDATRFLEEDPDRRLPDVALCGRGSSEAALDQLDPAWAGRTAEDRAAQALTLEQAVDAAAPEGRISSTVYVGDGSSDTARVMSNGFSDEHRSAWFAFGGEMTLSDKDGRRPEAAAYYSARYLDDMPRIDDVAAEIARRARERLGSRAIESGTFPMVLDCRAAGRILGALGGPLAGSSLHEGRSCLTGKRGEKLGSSLFTLIDDPTIPRGLASRPWDGDGLVATPRHIFREGVLEDYYISVYYGRKLGQAPTTGGRSNWVVPSGTRPLADILRDLPRAILVDGFLGGNSNGVTGDFSLGIRGRLLEHGEPTQSLSEMNVSGNLLTLFQRLSAVGDDPWPFSSVISPTLIFDDVQFSGQ